MHYLTDMTIDGVGYRVYIEAVNGAFAGVWQCLACGAAGQNSTLHALPDQAVQCATADLQFHHEAMHHSQAARRRSQLVGLKCGPSGWSATENPFHHRRSRRQIVASRYVGD